MTAGSEETLMELRFPARPDRMALVRSSVRSAARYCGFDELATQDIVLAVGEACQNVMRHAYGEQESGDIVVGILRGEDGIVLSVTDFAPPVDPARIEPRDLDDVRPGGLGIHFIRKLMDTADFIPAANGAGNVLRMTKKTEVST